MKTFIIAEIGSAWRYGDSPLQHLVNAQEAVRIAKEAGASCIKFQWTSDPRKMEKRRKAKKGTYDILAWPEKWIEQLYKECEKVGIEWMCTVFLPADVKVIDPYVKRFKVASLEVMDEQLFATIYKTNKPTIASTGASEIDDIKKARWLNNCEILQCTASYPASLEAINLNIINCSHEFHGAGIHVDGLSDHSADLMTGALAVARGAEIIEVHFRLSRTPKDNPDYPHSHSPERLRQYIDNIKKAEVMLGDGIKRVMPCEEWALKHKVKT